jgi:hypothetical protein
VRDTRVTMKRVGWSRAVLRPLLRALLLAGAAVVAYLAISLLDGPAQADSRPPAQPGHPSVLGAVAGGVDDTVSTVAGSLSTPDAGDGSDRAAAPAEGAEAGERAAVEPSGRPAPRKSALVGAVTSTRKVLPAVQPVLALAAGAPGAVANAAAGGTVNAIAGVLRDPPPILPLVDPLLPPQLTDPLPDLHQSVVASITATAGPIGAGLVASTTGSSEQQTESLVATLAVLNTRSPPPPPQIAVSTGSVPTRPWPDGPSGLRPHGPGGSGDPPVPRPAVPESSANGHLRAGGEGSPDRPAVDGRPAYEPESVAVAVVTVAEVQRDGRSAETDAPSG